MLTKVCSKCGKELDISKFPTKGNGKGIHVSKCHDCLNEYRREHRNDSKEEIIVRKLKINLEKKLKKKLERQYENTKRTKICIHCGKKLQKKMFNKSNSKDGFYPTCKKCRIKISEKYRENNLEKLLMYDKRRSKSRTESRKIYNKGYYEKNSDEIHKHNILYYEKNSTRCKKNSIRYRKENLEKEVIYKQRRNAIKRLLPHTLTVIQFKYTIHCFGGMCCYCGRKLPLTQDHFIPSSKGGGYTFDNIVPACGSCNSSKSDKDFSIWFKTYKYYDKTRELKILKYLGSIMAI